MQFTLILLFSHSLLLNIVAADDLLELGCTTDDQCKQFERSKCRNDHCFCTASDSDKQEPCKPKDQKLSNIIGGPCTQEHKCGQQHAECDEKTQLCYCAPGYLPSADRRRCIPKLVKLGQHCEQTTQCQAADMSAICNESQQICICKAHFEEHEGRCLSTLDVNCSNDTSCSNVEAFCLPKLKLCACPAGLVHSANMSNCMPGANYGASCTTNAQCQLMLGIAGVCSNKTCTCRANYYAQLNEEQNTTICEPVVAYGDACRQDKECQQVAHNHFVCKWAECVCQSNYHVVDNKVCVLTSAGTSGNQLTQILMLTPLTLTTAQFFWLIYSRI